jgi:heme-degrading monooxygenase HmoA
VAVTQLDLGIWNTRDYLMPVVLEGLRSSHGQGADIESMGDDPDGHQPLLLVKRAGDRGRTVRTVNRAIGRIRKGVRSDGEAKAMIKVIVEYRVKQSADIEPLLSKLMSNALTFPGFIGAENLKSEEDSSIIAMVQTWDRRADWAGWELSSIRQSILAEAKPLLEEAPMVTVYRVASTRGWDYVRRGS